MPAPLVTVVGSLNIDLVASLQRLPRPGETLAASTFATFFGGKGANQAIAAARHGARVRMIGCLGDDDHGRRYAAALKAQGIDTRCLQLHPGVPTGTALINVAADGENQIVLVAGANDRVSPAMVRRHAAAIRQAAAMLVQLETPLPAVLEALRLAADSGTRSVLNPSPWRPAFPWGAMPVRTLVVNEHEARELLGAAATDPAAQSARILRRLDSLKIGELVITRGARPTLVFAPGVACEVPTLAVRPVDTVGAGDTFAGTLATRLAEGLALPDAVRIANCAGALATLRAGAQASIPQRRAVERALASLPSTRSLLVSKSRQPKALP